MSLGNLRFLNVSSHAVFQFTLKMGSYGGFGPAVPHTVYPSVLTLFQCKLKHFAFTQGHLGKHSLPKDTWVNCVQLGSCSFNTEPGVASSNRPAFCIAALLPLRCKQMNRAVTSA